MHKNHREDKFLRATNYKHLKNGENTTKKSVEKKTGKKVKKFSFVLAFVLASACLIIPTTTLAPNVDAYENTKVAAYSVGNIDVFAEKIADNCVVVETQPVTEKATEATTVATEPQTTATELKKDDENKDAHRDVVVKEESEVNEDAQNNNEGSITEDYSNQYDFGGYLVEIDNPDSSYSPRRVELSDYDRAKLERLVMGEAGSMGYTGCALVAQAIRDAMNRSNTSSIDRIISEYQYYAPTTMEPNDDVKAAVSFIFDNNGSAVQHRVICFYTGTSNWHETQKYITTCGTVRFFDLLA